MIRTLTKDIAESIVRETMHRLHRNINMMDIEGKIIASGDSKRLGERHEGALEAIRTGKPLVIDEANRGHWKGSLCGINVPIVFREQIVGAIGITGQPEEVSEFGEIVKMTTELMLNQRILTSQQEWRNRAKEAILQELVKMDSDFDRVDGHLQMLDLRLKPSYYACILETYQDMAYNEQLVRKIEEIAGEGQALASVGGVHQIILLLYGITEKKAADKRERLKEMLNSSGISFRIGYSLPTRDRTEIPAAFREAEFALQFGEGKNEMMSYAGFEPRAIVMQSDAGSKHRFVERLLGELPEPLIETLDVFFNCSMSIQEAAQSLYVHRNTMIYRLKRIKELTGCDPQVFKDAAALQMAIWIDWERKHKQKQKTNRAE
ncbi:MULTISPECIES: CdaR family transcriptional regulator [unclassified Paenibacillus]|uniref:CdaR family transcriptional regulator n=1 Tax=unclassified Paenibacillus TaxID=185978 RepID=UPI003629B5A7